MLSCNQIGFLKEYKKYDFLNKDKTFVKIFVSYIKPSFLFKSEILTPVHLGRSVAQESSKDGIVSDEDLNWLYKNCIGDNDFEGNISDTNRRIGFLTGTYKAFKNYDKIGNPEYFGSFGYRRLLPAEALNGLENYDLILPKRCKVNDINNKACLINAHGIDLFNKTVLILDELYGKNIVSDFEEYLSYDEGYYFEQYIMKKEVFFKFCEWIFPVLFKLLEIVDTIRISEPEKQKILAYFKSILQENDCNNDNFDKYQLRSLGFMMERLTGFYEFLLVKSGKYKFREVETVVFEDRMKEIFAQLRRRV